MENLKQLFYLLNEQLELFLANYRIDSAPLAVVVAGSVVLLTAIFFSCCSRLCCRGGKKRPKVFGRIRDVTFHHGKGKKKTAWVDPFRPSNIDYQRRFEDEVTKFLYLLGVDVAQLLLNDYPIKFQDLEGNPAHSPTYYPDYRWILKHISHNCRDYALLLTRSKDTALSQRVHTQRDPGWTSEDVLEELESVKTRQSAELILSLACRAKELCQVLKEKANKRAHNAYLQDDIENEGNIRGKEAIAETMAEGVLLVELLKAPLHIVPKSLKDHYHNIITLQKMFADEFCPYVNVSRINKRSFAKLGDQERKREVLLEAVEDIIKTGNNDVLELMAVAVLPRFNYCLN